MDRQRLGYEEQAQFTTPSLFVISSAARPLPGPTSPPLPYLPAFLVDFSPISSDRVDYDTHTHTITVVYFTPPPFYPHRVILLPAVIKNSRS